MVKSLKSTCCRNQLLPERFTLNKLSLNDCCLANSRYDLVCLRMICSMSDQVSQLKMILRNLSNSSSTSGLIARESRTDATSTSSESTSTNSDFSFPAPASTPDTLSPLNSGAFQLIVQDLSAARNSGQSSLPESTNLHLDRFLFQLLVSISTSRLLV